MSPRWHSLPSRNISAPPLLYKFIYTTQSYEFLLTDLTHIWHESLQYKHILQKAEDIGTSIDPSEDANQYDVFMRKIQDALDGTKNTTVTIASGQKSHSVVVITSTKLPAGLNPLKWTFTLSKESPSAVTRHLLLPLLTSERDHEQREQSLLEHIKEKDNVLAKIFDKIDPSQLTSMFPGTAGIRHTKPKTSDLIRHIKGATRFDDKEWRARPADENNLANGLAESVHGHGGFTPVDNARTRDVAWWENLGDVDDTRSKSPERPQEATNKSKERAVSEEQMVADEDMSTEDEDGFQRQETPPHLKRKKDQGKKPVKDNESDIAAGTTESDQDAESDDGLDSIRAPVQKEKPQKKVMGRIGGPKAVPLGRPRKESVTDETDSDDELNVPKPRQRTPATREEPELDDGTESDSQPERIPTPSPPKAKKEPPTETVKKKGVLGKIGGKKSEPKKVPSPKPADTNDLVHTTSDDDDLQPRHARPKPQTTPKKGKKLGLIGGGKKKPQAAAVATTPEHEETDDDLSAGPSKLKQGKKVPSTSPSPPPPVSKSPSPIPHRAPKAEPEPELSAEQKANKKREDLKRQLDAKSKAPTKKKRKF